MVFSPHSFSSVNVACLGRVIHDEGPHSGAEHGETVKLGAGNVGGKGFDERPLCFSDY